MHKNLLSHIPSPLFFKLVSSKIANKRRAHKSYAPGTYRPQYLPWQGSVKMRSGNRQNQQEIEKNRATPHHENDPKLTAGQLALLSRTWLFVHLIEWLFAWSLSKNGLDWQRRTQISARCGSPEISLVWLSLTRWAWWIWVIYWSCRRASRRSAQRFFSDPRTV